MSNICPICIQSAIQARVAIKVLVHPVDFWDVLCNTSVALQRVNDQHNTWQSHRSGLTLMQRLTLNKCLCHGEGGSSCQRLGKCKEITF